MITMLKMILNMESNLYTVAGITSATQDQSKKKRAKKEPFKVDFDAELDVKQYFSTSRVGVMICDPHTCMGLID